MNEGCGNGEGKGAGFRNPKARNMKGSGNGWMARLGAEMPGKWELVMPFAVEGSTGVGQGIEREESGARAASWEGSGQGRWKPQTLPPLGSGAAP